MYHFDSYISSTICTNGFFRAEIEGYVSITNGRTRFNWGIETKPELSQRSHIRQERQSVTNLRCEHFFGSVKSWRPRHDLLQLYTFMVERMAWNFSSSHRAHKSNPDTILEYVSCTIEITLMVNLSNTIPYNFSSRSIRKPRAETKAKFQVRVQHNKKKELFSDNWLGQQPMVSYLSCVIFETREAHIRVVYPPPPPKKKHMFVFNTIHTLSTIFALTPLKFVEMSSYRWYRVLLQLYQVKVILTTPLLRW